jgi:hypothetical protein
VANLRRNPSCTVVVDRNERYAELQGVMLQGSAEVLEDAAAEEADPYLEAVRWQMGSKYASGHGDGTPAVEPVRNSMTAVGRSARWVAFAPDRKVSWDNKKLS